MNFAAQNTNVQSTLTILYSCVILLTYNKILYAAISEKIAQNSYSSVMFQNFSLILKFIVRSYGTIMQMNTRSLRQQTNCRPIMSEDIAMWLADVWLPICEQKAC